MTFILQSCDAGIIKAFKQCYKKNLVEFMLNSIDNLNIFKMPDAKDAIYLIKKAWKSVGLFSIENCWRKVDIIEKKDNYIKKSLKIIQMKKKLTLMS